MVVVKIIEHQYHIYKSSPLSNYIPIFLIVYSFINFMKGEMHVLHYVVTRHVRYNTHSILRDMSDLPISVFNLCH